MPKPSRSLRRRSPQSPKLLKRRKSFKLNLPTRRRVTLPPRASPSQSEPAPEPGRRPRPKKYLKVIMRRQLPSKKRHLSRNRLSTRFLPSIRKPHRSKRIPQSRNRLLLNLRMPLMLPRKRVPANAKSATTTRAVASASPVSRGAAIVRRAIVATARRTTVTTTTVASISKTVVSQLLLRFPRKILRSLRLLSFAKRPRNWRSTSKASRRQSLSRRCLLPA